MPKRIPVSAAREVAQKQGCSQVILVGWDGNKVHVVTYGTSEIDCDQAAMGGNRIKAALGWPAELCNAEPPRVTKLRKENSELRDRIKELERQLKVHGIKAKKCVCCGHKLTVAEYYTQCSQCGEPVPISRGSCSGDDPDCVGA